MDTKKRIPFIRSDNQGRLLAEVYLHPEREYSIQGLNTAIEGSWTSTQREVHALIDYGFLIDRISGRNHYVRVNQDHPLYDAIGTIAQHEYGAIPVLRDLLAGLPGLAEAWIFGSWARRHEGQPTRSVGDIDVLLVGEGLRNGDLNELAALAQQRLHIEVNFQKLTPAAFAENTDSFTTTVREGARVRIPLIVKQDGAA